MDDVAVLEDPAIAASAMDRVRGAMLGALGVEPASAAGLAAKLGLGRQKVNYHLGVLESQGLVTEVGRRRHGGIVERLVEPVAAGFVVSPAALGRVGIRPEHISDRLSSSYAIALAARVVREVGRMITHAQQVGKRLPVLAIDTDIRFRSAEDRAEFADDVAAAVRALAARYHDERSPGGRWYRVMFVAHPRPAMEDTDG